MAKTISCRDVGVDCDFKTSGESTDEVLQKCAQHAKDAHGMEAIPPELAVAPLVAALVGPREWVLNQHGGFPKGRS